MNNGLRIFTSVMLILFGLIFLLSGFSIGGNTGLFMLILAGACVALLILVNKKFRNSQNTDYYDAQQNYYNTTPTEMQGSVQPVSLNPTPIPQSYQNMQPSADLKNCPKCAMMIPKKAKVCPHCQSRIGGFSIGAVITAVVIILAAAYGIFILSSSDDESVSVSKGVYVEGECSTEFDELGIRYYTGTIRNDTNKDYSYVQVTIGFYDENGVKLESGIDNVLNLRSGDAWKFSVMCMNDKVKQASVEDIIYY